jgi:hypothetical protein
MSLTLVDANGKRMGTVLNALGNYDADARASPKR